MAGMSFEELESEALQLNPAARARLAETLLASLEALSNEQNENQWAAEAARRDRAWDLRENMGRSAPQVFRDARRQLD